MDVVADLKDLANVSHKSSIRYLALYYMVMGVMMALVKDKLMELHGLTQSFDEDGEKMSTFMHHFIGLWHFGHGLALWGIGETRTKRQNKAVLYACVAHIAYFVQMAMLAPDVMELFDVTPQIIYGHCAVVGALCYLICQNAEKEGYGEDKDGEHMGFRLATLLNLINAVTFLGWCSHTANMYIPGGVSGDSAAIWTNMMRWSGCFALMAVPVMATLATTATHEQCTLACLNFALWGGLFAYNHFAEQNATVGFHSQMGMMWMGTCGAFAYLFAKDCGLVGGGAQPAKASVGSPRASRQSTAN